MVQNDVLICAVAAGLGVSALAFRSFIFLASVIASIAFIAALVTYRLFFHPIARFPGPRLAAATYLYEFYYDLLVVPGGQYVWQLEKLHKQYGPILRISPDEIQSNDPEAFDKVYVSGAEKRHRWTRAGTGNTSPGALSSAYHHDLHRLRRSSLQNFFSKGAISRVESRLQVPMAQLRRMLESAAASQETVNFTETMAKVTLNFITEYVFGTTWDADSDALIGAMRTGFESLHLFKFFPLLRAIPRPLLKKIVPAARVITMWEQKCAYEVDRVKAIKEKAGFEDSMTVASEVLNSKLPDSEKTTSRLQDETQILVIAGSETTARSLSNVIYYVLSDEKVLSQVRQELDTALPDASKAIALADVERLPYLTAVIKETLRVLAATLTRSLIVADGPIQFKNWTIPPRTPVCVSFRALLYDEDVFPDPTRFDPSRWLGGAEDMQIRNKYLVAFSRGHRNCIGQNVAWAELYLASAIVFRGFELELDDVVYERDVKVVRDCFIGLPSPEAKGVRARVLRKRT